MTVYDPEVYVKEVAAHEGLYITQLQDAFLVDQIDVFAFPVILVDRECDQDVVRMLMLSLAADFRLVRVMANMPSLLHVYRA